jgi:putative cardiolipin synthase
MRITALAFVAVAMLPGCRSLPENVERTPSTSFERPAETAMGKLFGHHAAQHPGESGFAMLNNSRNAFTARIGLADLAERSLDLHPNVEIRVFNPFAHRSSHGLDFLSNFARVNQRMHNKVMIADGALAVVGGRNIGDHYFGVNTEANFRDLDIAAVGPIVSDIAGSFDIYWNSEWAYPIAAIYDKPYSADDIAKIQAEVAKLLAERQYPYPLDEDVSQLAKNIDLIAESMIWAQGRVLADDPATLTTGDTRIVKDAIIEWVGHTKHELLIESAYFVTRGPSIDGLASAVKRGIRVRVLTNSLASNDVVAAHAGYEKYRDDLLRAGVDIYELRPDAGKVRQEWSVAGGRSIAALHTKAIVIDRESTFVGSFNLDPRSGNINTEVGLVIDSRELAGHVAEFMDEGVVPENAYRVTLSEKGGLHWTTSVDGRETMFHKEPETSAWKRFVADFIKILPVESQL